MGEPEFDYLGAVAALKACPFCGGHEFMSGWDSKDGREELYFVCCVGCDAQMGEPGEKPESPIKDRWDRRADDDLRREVEKVRDGAMLAVAGGDQSGAVVWRAALLDVERLLTEALLGRTEPGESGKKY